MLRQEEIDQLIRTGKDRDIFKRILEEIANIESRLEGIERTVREIESCIAEQEPAPEGPDY